MSRSIPAGGQMTPFDRASLSLRGWEPPPPTVGGSPLTSGGHVAPCSGDAFSVGCASPAPTGATPTNAAMIRMVVRKGNSSRTCRAWLSTSPGAKSSRGPAAASARVDVDFVVAKSRSVSWSVATVSALKPHERASLGRHDRSLDRSARLDPNRCGITRGQQRYRGRNCGRRRGWYRRRPAAHGCAS
jgi:hypothetical protein